ncbi:hypothetical protein ACELLULO517_20985 [Acidisoma cellulosilytica]|uniref:Uncharacterized protein n=1 Tax=Acidisoma cellulosilyticum TaxID=2802395 RepID=A0A963Z4R2_9PROT|nr:hypothetical protein [Acidisoma cellulosilyticum]MCB8882733.1 hypothetical protein [Acidisoma cellulosilyticum]
MTFLLTYHGTLLCRDGAKLVHRSVDNRAGVSPVRLDLPWERVRSDFDRNLRAKPAEIRSTVPFGDLAGFTLHIEPDRRSVLLSQGDRYLSAQLNGSMLTDREQAAGWERFVPVQMEELDRLLSLRAHDWVLSTSSRRIPARSVRLSTQHGLWFDEHHFDLRYQLPLLGEHEGRQLTLLRDSWRIAKARAFKPLICYSAVGNPLIFEQLVLSLTSLLRWGRYKGDIHLATDRNPAELLNLVPELDPSRVSFKHLTYTDRIGAMTARYSLMDWPELAAFQPLLIVDTDIIFDADIEPLLTHIVLSDRIVVPAEEFSPRRSAESVGAKLFSGDYFDPGARFGFNSGSIGLPNLHRHGDHLQLIRRIIGNRSDVFGRGHFTWVDQPIANYVAELVGGFETSHMGQYVRWGGAGMGVAGRCGLVHFWKPRGPAEKLRAMKDYVRALDQLGG